MLGFLVFGLLIGIVVRWFLPGRQYVSLRMTVVLGFIAAAIGGIVADVVYDGELVDNIIGVVIAVVLTVFLLVVADRLGIGRKGDGR